MLITCKFWINQYSHFSNVNTLSETDSKVKVRPISFRTGLARVAADLRRATVRDATARQQHVTDGMT